MTPALLLLLALPAQAPEKPAKTHLDGFKFRSLGPAVTSGRVVGFAVNPRDRANYFVAVACGGVWRTTNSGTTWTPVFDEQGSYSIGCVVLDPKNPSTVWVGTGENNSQRSVAYGDGVYKSTDAGKTWQNVGLKASEHTGKILIDPKDSDTVYVAAQGPLWGPGGDRGLYKTTDGGKTWAKVLNIDENTGVTDVVQDPRDPNVLVAASYQRRRHVWTLINGGPGSGIHRSTDAGKTWKKITAGLPKDVDLGRIGLAMSPANPSVIYATVEAANREGGVFRSTDGGVSWEKRNPSDSQAQYYSHPVADPVNPDRVYLNNVFIQVSDDGAKTFRGLGDAAKHVDNHEIWVDPRNPNFVLAGCDGGVYESFDRGANWHFKSNLPVTQFYDIAVDQNPASGPFYRVYGGTQDNYTLGGPVRSRSAHGLKNDDWQVVQGGDGFQCAVDPTDPNTVYAESQYGGLTRFDRRTNTNVDIQPQAKPGEKPLRWNWDSPLVLSEHNSKRLYYAANILFRSDDRGDTWTAVSGDLTRQLNRDDLPVMGKMWGPDAVSKHVSTSFYGNCVALAESPVKEGQLYVGTDDGLIQIQGAAGGAWTKIDKFPGVPERTYVSELVAGRHAAGTVYAAFDNHKNADFKPYLLKSTDAGRTWASIAGDLPERGTVYSLAEDPTNPNLLFCGTEFALYVSVDGGAKWQRMKAGLPTIMVKDLQIQRAQGDLVVGTFGRGFYVLDDYTPLREITPEILAQPAHLAKPRAGMLSPSEAQYGGGGKAFLGASFYTADNPPAGVTFTLHLKDKLKTLKEKRKDLETKLEKEKQPLPYPSGEQLRAEAEEEAPAVLLFVFDFDGNLLRTVPCPNEAGLHRVTWDLRQAGTTNDDGPRVVPGRYRASLAKKEAGVVSPLSPPIEVTVLPDPIVTLTAADYVEIAAFDAKVVALRRSMNGTVARTGEVAAKLDAIKKALDVSVRPDDPAKKAVADLAEKVKVLQRQLTGDPFLAGRNENTPPSVRDAVGFVTFAGAGAVAKPTGSQKALLDVAAKELAAANATLTAILKTDLPAVEAKLDAAGAPYTPGREPKIK